MLTPPDSRRAWSLLDEYGLADVIFRHWPRHGARTDISRMALYYSEGATLGLVLATVTVMRCPASDSPAEILACFTPSRVNEAVRAVRQALKISNEESEEMRGTLLGLGPLLGDSEPTLAQKKRFLARPTAPLSRQLMRLLAGFFYFPDRIRSLDPQLDALSKTDFAPAPLVTGDDLTAAGYAPGPKFKRVLDGVYDAQLEDRVRTKGEAMELTDRMFAEGEAPRR